MRDYELRLPKLLPTQYHPKRRKPKELINPNEWKVQFYCGSSPSITDV